MAVQGVPADGLSAQQSQYDQAPQQPLVPTPDRNEVAGEQVAGEQAQESRQLGAEAGASDELPFTGFAAIPVLLMGFVLLTAGFVLRRRA